MKHIQSEFFVKQLKDRIKQSGLTYAEIAKELKMSLPGVKKMLNNQDISISRAFEICNLLGIDILETISHAESELVEEKKFTTSQESAFLKQPELFFFYMRLAYEKLTIEQIQTEHGLSEAQSFKFLKKLDDLNLIQLGAQNRFRFKDGHAARLKTTGTKLNDLKFQATQRLLEKVRHDDKGFLGGGIFFLSSMQIEDLKKDIFNFHDKYSKISMQNRSKKSKTSTQDLKTHTTMFISIDDTLFQF